MTMTMTTMVVAEGAGSARKRPLASKGQATTGLCRCVKASRGARPSLFGKRRLTDARYAAQMDYPYTKEVIETCDCKEAIRNR